MSPCLVLITAALSASGSNPPPLQPKGQGHKKLKFVIAPRKDTQEKGWVRSAKPPLQIAREVDTRLNQLSGTSLNYSFRCHVSAGYGGQGNLCFFKSPSVYRIEYPIIGNRFTEGLEDAFVVSDGKHIATMIGHHPAKIVPFTTHRSLPSNLVDDWFHNSAADLFTAIGSTAKPLEQLVTQASRRGSGYEVHTDTREVTFRNIPRRFTRIMIERNKAREKKEGVQFYEIVISDRFKLPTSMTNERRFGKVLYTVDFNRTDWNPDKNQRFDPSWFDVHHIGPMAAVGL